MGYDLKFVPSALKEWEKLDRPVREQFKAKLAERLNTPRVPGAQMHNYPNCYKVKLRAVGYRLVYEVQGSSLVVLTVGKRERGVVYKGLSRALKR